MTRRPFFSYRLARLDLDPLGWFAHSRDFTVHGHVMNLEELGGFNATSK